MKQLLQTMDRQELDQVRFLLESRGIPVFVGNENTATNAGLVYAARQFLLWVMIDEQWPDAVALLRDETHEVAAPVDVEEFYRNMEQYRGAATRRLFDKMMLALVLIVASLLALFFFARVFH